MKNIVNNQLSNIRFEKNRLYLCGNKIDFETATNLNTWSRILSSLLTIKYNLDEIKNDTDFASVKKDFDITKKQLVDFLELVKENVEKL